MARGKKTGGRDFVPGDPRRSMGGLPPGYAVVRDAAREVSLRAVQTLATALDDEDARMASNARRKAERAKGGVLAFRIGLEMHGWKPITDPRVVVLTRISPKPFDDDNNAAALKSVRDGMAEAWGINDADPRVTWVTDWRKGKAHAVEAALWVVPMEANEHHPEPSMSRVFEQGFDADDYNGRPRVVVHGGLIQRREVRVTPNVIRNKGGA